MGHPSQEQEHVQKAEAEAKRKAKEEAEVEAKKVEEARAKVRKAQERAQVAQAPPVRCELGSFLNRCMPESADVQAKTRTKIRVSPRRLLLKKVGEDKRRRKVPPPDPEAFVGKCLYEVLLCGPNTQLFESTPQCEFGLSGCLRVLLMAFAQRRRPRKLKKPRQR